MFEITDHAYQRAKDRCGWNKKALDRMLIKVVFNGIDHKDCSGLEKKYIDKVFLTHKNASLIKIYGEFIFIFRGNFLITILRLPKQFIRRK